MSWSAPEYLYLVMVLNQVQLPEDALFVIRCAYGRKRANAPQLALVVSVLPPWA